MPHGLPPRPRRQLSARVLRDTHARVTFSWERFTDCLPELAPMMERHGAEVSVKRSRAPLDINYELHCTYQLAGLLQLLTARRNGELVGYMMALVGPHLDYRSTRWCSIIKFYLAPECRVGWTAIHMFKAFERKMRELDVAVVNGTEAVRYTNGRKYRVAKLFTRLGYRMIERVFSKEL